MSKIIAVCTSANKGERKTNVGSGELIKNKGLRGDAHAGFDHRQISLLAFESIKKMQENGLNVGPGDFAENLTTQEMDLTGLPVGQRFKIGTDAILRVTQIGEECHHHGATYQQAEYCVLPEEGIFAEVLLGGPISQGDTIRLLPSYRFGVLTASDKGSQGQRDDESGPLIEEMLTPWGDTCARSIVADEKEAIKVTLMKWVDEEHLDLVMTTGGTGFSPRDVTPEATLEIIDRQVPGIPETMRATGLTKTPKAMLSRAVAGIRKQCLIVNLPGSPRAVRENLDVILPILEHALEILTGRGGECGEKTV